MSNPDQQKPETELNFKNLSIAEYDHMIRQKVEPWMTGEGWEETIELIRENNSHEWNIVLF